MRLFNKTNDFTNQQLRYYPLTAKKIVNHNTRKSIDTTKSGSRGIEFYNHALDSLVQKGLITIEGSGNNIYISLTSRGHKVQIQL